MTVEDDLVKIKKYLHSLVEKITVEDVVLTSDAVLHVDYFWIKFNGTDLYVRKTKIENEASKKEEA